MAIRFRCHHCGQKLRVSDDKAGLQAKCPKCKLALTVPNTSSDVESAEPAVEEQTRSPDKPPSPFTSVQVESAPVIRTGDAMMLPEIVIRDDSEDWVRDSTTEAPRTETVIDYDKVAVPRRILYLQGALLAVVALVSFVLGTLMGGGTNSRKSAGMIAQPCVLSGRVSYGEQSRPDSGSVIIVLPVDRRPMTDSRVAVEGLRPGDPVPTDGNLSLRTIRSLGGDFVLANDEGNYQVRLPEQGRYHVLVISRRAPRSGSDKVELTDVAQIGRYFTSPVDLLDDRKYQWRTLTLHGDATLDATF